MAPVVFHQVTKEFPGGTTAVDALDLEIPDGELMVLVGPSGCGKSTALRMIAGLEQPSSGRITIGERDMAGLSPGARDVAMVFQSYALYPHMSVRDNLAFPLRRRRMARDEIGRRVAEMAEMLELGELLKRKPAQLSGGQRQRVAMGRALIREPVAFLLDEPLSNLDAKLRTELRAELKRLHRRLGTTMVYVTHDQIEAMTLGDRIAVMNRGRLQQVGSPDEIYRRPCNLFVGRFVGSPAMNLLPGPVVGRGADVIAGVRPEAMHRAGEVAGGIPLELVTDVVEPLGSDVYVHGSAGGEAVVARLPGNVQVSPGDRLALAIDPADLHLFDRETEGRLAHE
ncbi:MAG TPA: ATP-binding cassette domain-containing protein [Gaiellales bacterium]|nr:ATP-binding cassette domain-containing protein [Gaiellales bacterium]